MSDTRDSRPFNSPLESGLRSLYLLVEAHPKRCDLQRLLFYDYLVVHSADADGPESLHPATPHRSGEILVRRGLVERGLLLMLSRGLVERSFDENGIEYCASDGAASFLACLETPYAHGLANRAHWVVGHFGEMSLSQLESYFRSNLDRWGGEFEFESLIREVPAT